MKKFLKKLTATVLTAAMVMAMGITVFAAGNAEALADGTYTADQNLYKNADCTEVSMGDDAVKDLKAQIIVTGATSTIVVHTHEITYKGLTGHLGAMTLKDSDGNSYIGTATDGEYAGETDYIYTFSGFPTSQIADGCVFEGQYTVKVSIMPIKATGYLKLTNIVAE